MSISVPSTVKNFLKPIQAVGAMISQFGGDDSSDDDDLSCEKCKPTSATLNPKSARARLDRVTRLRDAIHEHTSHGSDSNNALRHARLGRALHARFEKNSDPHDLDEAIAELSNAMRILPPRHRHKPMYESNVGLLLCVRYEHTHQEVDLKRAITHCRTALEAADNNDVASPADKAWYRANLATSLLHRYERSKDTSLLSESLALWKTAVSSLEEGHPDKPSYYSNISAVFLARYNHTAELGDLNRAVDAIRESVNGLNREDSHWIIYQYMSSSLYYRRYNVTGRVQDLNMAINTGRSALQALPDNHRYIPRYQTELASKLVSRFEKQGVIEDVNEAIDLSKSVAAAPAQTITPNDPVKSYSDRYTILSRTLAKRFESTEDDGDLEESIKYARAAASAADKLGLTPLERQAAHQNLADRAYQRFERTGDLGDLNESISHGITASEILTVNTRLLAKDTTKAEFANHLTSLSSQHLTRFEYEREAADLDNAVTYARAALDMASQRSDKVPPSAAERYALGIALFRRFEQYGQDDDLEDSLVQSRLAFDLASQQVTGSLSPGAPISRKTLYQFLLSGVLCARYKRKKEKADLDGAIVHAEAVLKATPKDHPLYDMYYSIYTYAVDAASENGTSIEQAISQTREEAEQAAATRDPGWGKLMLKLANLQYTRFETGLEEGRRSSVSAGGGLTGDLDLEHAMNAWKKVAAGPSNGTKGAHGLGPQETAQFQALSVRMRAALKWADAACRHGRTKPAVEAYKVVLELAPRAAIAGITSHAAKGKGDELALHTLSLASDAAAAAIQLNQLETAVEFLEQARNALWAQELGLPSEVDKLERVNPHLAKHVRELALEQERGSTSSPRSPVSKPQLHLRIPNKTPTKVKPDLEDRWEATLGTVRAAEEGFGGFMRPWKFETVKDGLPLDGIIVFLNCSRLRCDGIVLTPAGHLHSVPLSNRTNQKSLEEFTKIFVQGSRDICEGRITGSDFDRDVLNPISLHLWEAVVRPITESLGKMALGPSRIWWIPTGAFTWLPIHAAAPLQLKSESGDALGLEPETIIPTDCASSYAVTLRSLLRPLHGAAQKAMLRTSPTRHILAIGSQPARRTTSLLGGLGTSVQCLKNHITGMDNVSLVALEGPSHATFTNICRALKPAEHSVDVLHISLPVQVDPIQLSNSAWVGADGAHIKLADVLTITTSGRDTMPEFAFITSPSLRIDGFDAIPVDGEFLTMAGAMQFSGVGSVVGALWTTATEDSAAIAKRVYARMFPGRTPPSTVDGDERRLDGFVDGVETLRKAQVPLHRTLPFVHYGL